jgi:hypothetical protein
MLPNVIVQLIAAPILGRQLMRIGTKRLSIAGALVAGRGMILLSYLAFIDLPQETVLGFIKVYKGLYIILWSGFAEDP